MAEINIPVTTEEKQKIYRALQAINEMEHVQHISYASFATLTGLKETKVRLVVGDMVDKGELQQINVSEGKVPRYYYVALENSTGNADIK